MNYLAHLHLSNDNPNFISGSVLGDFIKGNPHRDFDKEIAYAIMLHRNIDSFTDKHAIVRKCRESIHPDYRRFSGIMLDIIFDHFLAKHWSLYSDKTLESFTQEMYIVLNSQSHIYPIALTNTIEHMTKNDWLSNYQYKHNIAPTLRGISHRIKRENNLADSHHELIDKYNHIESQFFIFFPELIEFAKQHKAKFYLS